MGISCSCLNDFTSLCSEDLSHNSNNKTSDNHYINNNPTANLTHIEEQEKYESKNDQQLTTMTDIQTNNVQNLPIKNSLDNEINITNSKGISRNKTKFNVNFKNDLNKMSTDNTNTKASNNSIDSITLNKINNLKNKKFEEFIITEEEKENSIKMNENPSYNLSRKLHKYFLKLITKKKFMKNIKNYRQLGDNIFNKYVELFYNSNQILTKCELSCKIKYSQDGYKKFYQDISSNEEKEMKFIPDTSYTIDNSILIKYNNDVHNDNIDINQIVYIFKGQVNLNGIPNGYGVKYSRNGFIKQEGYWKDGNQIGWSQSIDYQGNILMGPFDDNKINGKGMKYSFNNSSLYIGDIVNNKKEGIGEEIIKDGKYNGKFFNDKKNGEGKMVYNLSGDIYEGNFKNDVFDGKGHYIWKFSGHEYTGEYKNGLMHGKGLYEWSEGEYYRGDFLNGKREGIGEMHWANGRSFVGPFVNGRPHGIGIFDNDMNYKGEMEFIDGKLNREILNKKNKNSDTNSLQSSFDKNDNL